MLPNNNSTPLVSALRPMYDYLNKQKDNQKLIRSVEITATFILISFFLVFAILPTASAISGLIGEIKAKELMVKTLKSKINNVITAQDAFSQIQERYALISSSLPDRPDYYGATNQVVGVMKELGIPTGNISYNLNELDAKDNNLQKSIKSFTISFPLKCDFSQSKKLISQLIANRRTSFYPSVSYQLKESESGSGLSLDLTATFYYWDKTQ